jgi:hypothetical protein
MSDNNVTISSDMPPVAPGIYLATVTGILDPSFNGMLQVKLIHAGSGNSNYRGQHLPVKYMSPFFGSTSSNYTKKQDDYDSTQKSYGMWMIPPDVGNTVIVLFMQGSPKFGYYIGCVPDDDMNFSVPGLAATKYNIDGVEERVPVAEFNRKINDQVKTPTKIPKPQHLFTERLVEQGLIKDDTRGITTSSARREVPSTVFGISTPGPVDEAGPKGEVGTKDDFANVPVSRLGGTTFVMDDGDSYFLRKTLAGEGPPEYASVENEDFSGLLDVPHNELVRIRTRTGHQILLHNSEDLIYIGNAKGTSWIELSSNGKIDIYAEDSISIHTKNDLNILADRDINLEAKRNINIKAGGTSQIESVVNTKVYSGSSTFITSGGSSHINSGANHIESTGGKIYMNSSTGAIAVEPLKTYNLPDETGEVSIESIMLRVPTHEPWPHHENLDPLAVSPEKTDSSQGADIPVPTAWTNYSLTTDTFEMFVRPTPSQEA